MNRPAHAIAQPRIDVFSSRRGATLFLVAVLHVLLVYTIISGLAVRVIEDVPHILTVDVKPQHNVEQKVLPPPQAALVKPVLPTVPLPVIRIARTAPRKSITVHALRVAPTAPSITAARVTPEPVKLAPRAEPVLVPAQGIAATHTIPPYPDLARRLNEEGTVLLAMTVGVQGHVRAAQILQSSGSKRLDQAAQAWVLAHWRYRPAHQGGVAAESTVRAAVVFSLRAGR